MSEKIIYSVLMSKDNIVFLCLELVLTGDSEVSPPSEEFDEVGGDLVFDGQEAGELYDQSLFAASAD